MNICGCQSSIPFASPTFASPSKAQARYQSKCVGPFGDDGHEHQGTHVQAKTHQKTELAPSKVGVSEQLRHEVVDLTADLVRIDSSPTNLVAGQNAVLDSMAAYAKEAGLAWEMVPTVNGKQALIVTLPGQRQDLGPVGFVHHCDVVQPEGEWKLGQPFSGNLTNDEQGRPIMVGRGTVDTKGPAAQILVAMKHLKSSGEVPERSMKLFIFPDEEFSGKDGAYFISKNRPELISDVQYWVVEGSGILDPEFIGGLFQDRPVPYVAMAQKYTIPMQMELKNPTNAQEAIHKTFDGLDRADRFVEDRKWSYLGDKTETKESMRRMSKAIGGFKGFLIRHFYNWGFMQKRMGKGNTAANRSDFCKTDFYLSNNSSGKPIGPNVKPSSATAVFQLDLQGEDRQKAIAVAQKAAGQQILVQDDAQGRLLVSLPQENYHGGNHGSTADREQDAVDVTHRASVKVEQAFQKEGLADKLHLVDFRTSKSAQGAQDAREVQTKVTLDLRVAVGEDPKSVIADLQNAIGPEFELKSLMGPEQMEANVRRLKHDSPLFKATEQSILDVYGSQTPVLFGNTTASNDTRFLMSANPNCETVTFVPVLYTRHGAHGPDEAVTIQSLVEGVDWTVDFMKKIGSSAS